MTPFADFALGYLREAQANTAETDPAQGVVALRLPFGTYFGHVEELADAAVVFRCVARNGDLAPYPLCLPLAEVQAVRYADLYESPDANFTSSAGPY